VWRPWVSREIAIVLPIGVARALFERATGRSPDEAEEVSYVNLWRPPRQDAPTPPAGGFWLRWRHPSEDDATIEQVVWDPDQLGERGDERILAAVRSLAGEGG
jgi:hypothetical protein